MNGSHVERDFLWKSHDLEKAVLDRMTQETGGLLSMYVAPLIRFAWAGYMLEIKLPPGMDKPHKWKVQFQGPAAQSAQENELLLSGAPAAVRQHRTRGPIKKTRPAGRVCR